MSAVRLIPACAAVCALSTPAAAWAPAELLPLVFDREVTALAIGPWGGEPIIAVGTAETVMLYDAEGESLVTETRGATDLLLHDLDGDGGLELVVCGPQGIALLRGNLEALGAPFVLGEAPCEAVEAFQPSGRYASLAVAGEGALTIWAPKDGGIHPLPWEGTYDGAPLLTGSGKTFALGSAGRRELQEGPALRVIPTREPVAALAVGRDGWTWMERATPPVVVDETQKWVEVHPDALGLLSADLDGDGRAEAVVREPTGLAPLNGEATLQTPTRPRHAAAGDLDGDGCTDLVLADGDRGVLIRGDCGGAVPPLVSNPSTPESPTPQPVIAPELPSELVIGPDFSSLRVAVGQHVDLQLQVPGGGATRGWAVRGEPPGLAVSPTGRLTFTPVRRNIGLWSVGLRVREGAVSRWSGVNVEVVEAAAPASRPPAP